MLLEGGTAPGAGVGAVDPVQAEARAGEPVPGAAVPGEPRAAPRAPLVDGASVAEAEGRGVAAPAQPVEPPDRQTRYYEHLLYVGALDANRLRGEVAATLMAQAEPLARRLSALRAACVRLPDEVDPWFRQVLSAPSEALGADGDALKQGAVGLLLDRAGLGHSWRARLQQQLVTPHPWIGRETRQRAVRALFSSLTLEERGCYAHLLDVETDPAVLETMRAAWAPEPGQAAPDPDGAGREP